MMSTLWELHGWLVLRWLRAGLHAWWPGRPLLVIVRALIDKVQARRADAMRKALEKHTKSWQRHCRALIGAQQSDLGGK